MDFFIDNWMLIAVALASGAMLLWPTVAGGGGAGGLSANDAVMRMNRDKAVVVDVRNTEEFATGHIGQARNVPLEHLETELPKAVKNKAVPVIVVCATGTRARRAVGIVKKLGYDNAQVLTGGMGAWRTANLPVHKA